MNIRKLIAGAATALLVGGGLALATLTPASAHTPEVTADCSALNISLTNYSHSTEGTPAVDAVYTDIPHHDLVTAAVPAVPGVPAVATTYVQEWKFVQKNHEDHVQWHEFTWNDPGQGQGNGWNRTSEHRDTTTVLKQGTPAIPGKDAVPAVYNDWTEHKLVSQGSPAVAGQTNHVSVTDNGASLVATDFSTSYSHPFASSDKTIEHVYHVVVTAYDDPTGSHGWTKTYDLTVAACEAPPVEPKDGVINPVTTTEPTCEAGVTYTVPEQADYVKYELNGETRPTPGTYTLGAGQTVTIGAHIAAQNTVENGGEYNPLSYSITLIGADKLVTQDCFTQPDAVVTHDSSTVKDCTAKIITTHHTTTTTEYVWDAEQGKYVLGTPVTTKDADTTVAATTTDCPVVVVVTPPAPPAAPAVVAKAVSPVPTDGVKLLAKTGSEVPVFGLSLVGAAVLISGLILALAGRRRKSA